MASKNKDHISAILAGISNGASLHSICKAGRAEHDDFPAPSTFLLWVSQDTKLAEQYARAMEARADFHFDEMLDIADDGRNDFTEREIAAGVFVPVVDHEHVQRSRLRIDARKWMLARMNPKKYGDKVTTEITGKDGGPVQSEVTASPDAAKLLDEFARLKAGASAAVEVAGDGAPKSAAS